MDKKKLQRDILEAPYNRTEWINVLHEYFGLRNIPTRIQHIKFEDNELGESFAELGNFYTADERLVGVFEVHLKENAWLKRNKVGLRNLLASHIGMLDAALVVFIQNHKWRFSFVSEILTEDGVVTTEPKRYTYVFGEGEVSRTAADRFDRLRGKTVNLKDIFEAFNVDKLNDEFFKTYKEFYKRFSDYLANNKSYYNLLVDTRHKEEVKRQKPIRDFSKKLLGRLVFLQFLQKKGWMGVPAEKTNWVGGDGKFLQNLFLQYDRKDRFHSRALRTLFFETLNAKRENDIAPSQIGKSIKIPYLNGGLFDKDISYDNDIDFPSSYFEELFAFFEMYNFTIDENDPYDNEVGIDPEMLGHIFENLLEENRDKGAFYTPKEVVHYMCHESLYQYLCKYFPISLHDDISTFIKKGRVSESIAEYNKAKEIDNLLSSVKICDPAIGSGAFPMGMLHEIFYLRRLLFAYINKGSFISAKVKKEIIQNNIYGVDIDSGAVDIARLRFWLSLVVDEEEPQPLPNLDYKIMQGNSLLEEFDGIDLKFEKIKYKTKEVKAVDLFGNVLNPQYSLTSFLQTKEDSAEFDIIELEDKYFNNNNYEQKQEIKSRIEQFEKDFINQQLERRIEDLKIDIKAKTEDYEIKIGLHNNDQKGKTKAQIAKDIRFKKNLERQKKEIERLSDKLKDAIQKKVILRQLNTSNKPYFLWHLYFMDVFDKGGFDIIIANPPYIQLQKDGGELATLYKNVEFETFERTGDIYALFYEKAFELLNDDRGVITFITSSQWMRTKYGKSLRRYFLKYNPKKLILLGPAIFKNAVVDTNILVATKETYKNELMGVEVGSTKLLEELVMNNMLPMTYITDDTWQVMNTFKLTLKKKLEERGMPLSKWNVEINRGILTGYNLAFIIDSEKHNELVSQDERLKDIIKPVLRGRAVDSYYTQWDGGYIIFIPWHFPLNKEEVKGASLEAENKFNNQYPLLYRYLVEFKNKLLDRNKEETNIRYEWYCLQRCAATYYEEFSKEKVIWKRIGSDLRFTYSNEELYSLDSTCIATGEKIKYLTALLNSKLIKYMLTEYAPRTGMGDLLISVQALDP